MCCEHSARRRGRFIAPVSLHNQIYIFISPHTHLNIIKYTYPFHRTHISVLHFVGVFIYAGTINRPLRLLVVCDNAANGLLIMLRSPTKLVTNIPPGVGADSSRPYPCITKYTYSFHHTRILTSSNTHIHFTAHTFPSSISWVYSYMRAR